MPDEPEVLGLLALMLLVESRRPARTAPDGTLVPLAEQDPSRWDGDLAEEGRDLVRRCLRRGQPGPYQVQAAIQAVHSEPPTDWRQVVALYDHLLALTPTPMVALNRAVAVAELAGPATALPLVDALRDALGEHHLFHATRAALLRRLDRDRRGGRRLRRGGRPHPQRGRARLPRPPAHTGERRIMVVRSRSGSDGAPFTRQDFPRVNPDGTRGQVRDPGPG